ncbi:DUF411 domain-containing protein [Silvimonas iriomotensis]|uniref:CopG family transcriptional regulator n=1 Tax=Silvimonas iriomotensis TaxID=449662 RepID=A0ABQ2PCE5_9NEIS|nr:DUF411 domain-containing protein [Silvimonas iriomotensis]GGP23202.1 hypothetical protein GCM10010970_32020 [Silvimonas iriomotensis]
MLFKKHLLVLALASATALAQAGTAVTLYKNAGCSCCEAYIAYLKSAGFSVKAENAADMGAIRQRYGSANAASCHTMRIAGYTVEGHVPVAAIKQLLQKKPAIVGISVPGMPMNSPGMGEEKPGTLPVYTLKTANSQPTTEFGRF